MSEIYYKMTACCNVKIYYKGTDCWHNEFGPAVVHANGRVMWWLNNKSYIFDEYCKELNLTDEDNLVLILIYGK